MRKLVKLSPPPKLEDEQDELVAEYLASMATTPWQRKYIKDRLIEETDGRCAYCDSEMRAVSYAEVEHIKPKSRFPELVVKWDNLTIACARCNRKKLNYYNEEAPIVDPYSEDPRDFLRFIGDMVLPVPGNRRGRVSFIRLDLKRWNLVKARSKRIEEMAGLVDEWASSENEGVKETLEGFIRENLNEGPYYENVRAFLESEKFPLEPDRIQEAAG